MVTLSDIKLFLAEYFKNKPVVRAWIFGSFSRGEEREDSDIDILVDLDHTHSIGLAFFGMFEDIKAKFGRKVDFVTTSSLADFARKSVDRDKILVYERNF